MISTTLQANLYGFFLGFLVSFVWSGCKGKEEKQMDTPPPVVDAKKVIKSPIAGSWYSANPNTLKQELQSYMDRADISKTNSIKGRLLGLISPHAGYRYSGPTAAYGYKVLSQRKAKRIIIIAPSHYYGFGGIALTDATHWQTPLGEIPIDIESVKKLAEINLFSYRSDVWNKEHSLDIQIPFIQMVCPEAKIVPLVAGKMTPEMIREAGKAIRGLWDKDTVVIASSDFTHYGPNYGYMGPPSNPISKGDAPSKLKALAESAFEAIKTLDFQEFEKHLDKTEDTICGHVPISVLLSAIPKRALPLPLKFETSGDVTEDYSNSVSYFSIAFFDQLGLNEFQGIESVSPEDQKFLLELARETIRRHLSGKPLPQPDEKKLSEGVKRPSGVFVTLKKHGNLRGCIGSIYPDEPLYKNVIKNAVAASTEDSRFRPMTIEEEPEVEIEISVLTPPKKVDGPEDILVGRDGVILSKAGRRAVFLPQVAPEQNWDLETMLAHLSLKAGLPSNAWRSQAEFMVFQAHVFHEK